MSNTFQHLIDISLEAKENVDGSKSDLDAKFIQNFSLHLIKKEPLSTEADQNGQIKKKTYSEGTAYMDSFNY